VVREDVNMLKDLAVFALVIAVLWLVGSGVQSFLSLFGF